MTPEQLQEVNIRVAEIINTFKVSLINQASFKRQIYWSQGLGGNIAASEQASKEFDGMKLIAEIFDKELGLVLHDDRIQSEEEHRKIKNEMVAKLFSKIEKDFQGYPKFDHNLWLNRVVSVVEETMNKTINSSALNLSEKFPRKGL